ncbi:hypothetical protein BCR43DRAFT_564123 [Syncephalastrum racemosum]|uniref:Uncharacterized protein n=1 Tax=Syncephalastrum racemosum TaxID=13706 RepID=A0A1X2HDS0_SYNRA|nr:hypothetical protein BCR43DRAFT_564123 [Syncephalastrum racemosum]
MAQSMVLTHQPTRRVSFDLGQNTVHILPSHRQCRKLIERRNREELQRRMLSEIMLCDTIVSEIEQEVRSSSSSDEDSQEEDCTQARVLKSCLKKLPEQPAVQTSCVKQARKKTTKKSAKKGKRNHRGRAWIPAHPSRGGDSTWKF